VTITLFLLLGALTTLASVVAVARLNAGTTRSEPTWSSTYRRCGDRGVALSGGSGTIWLGAGGADDPVSRERLLLMDVSIGYRMVIIGQVLIVAVVFDVVYRRYSGERLT